MITWEELGKAINSLTEDQKKMSVTIMDEMETSLFFLAESIAITGPKEELLDPGTPLIVVPMDIITLKGEPIEFEPPEEDREDGEDCMLDWTNFVSVEDLSIKGEKI